MAKGRRQTPASKWEKGGDNYDEGQYKILKNFLIALAIIVLIAAILLASGGGKAIIRWFIK